MAGCVREHLSDKSRRFLFSDTEICRIGDQGSAIAATYRAAGAAGHLDQALAGVQVAERDAEGICRIRLRGGGEFQQMGYHMLHLLLGSATGADHRLLDLGGRVFAHRQIGIDRGDDGVAPGLTQILTVESLGSHLPESPSSP